MHRTSSCASVSLVAPDGSRIDRAALVRMILAATAAIKANVEQLSLLDAACGDGDHGETMRRVANALVAAVQEQAPSPRELLSRVAAAFFSVEGGATGPLFGTFFLGSSVAVEGDQELDCQALARAFQAGLEALRVKTKAREGDKTLLDALIPAVAALQDASDSGAAIDACLSAAANGARQGAARTRDLLARFGKARFAGERARGYLDPGAVSVAILLHGFHAGWSGAHCSSIVSIH